VLIIIIIMEVEVNKTTTIIRILLQINIANIALPQTLGRI